MATRIRNIAPVDANTNSQEVIRTDAICTLLSLSEYCQANHWAGYDPYDALNSRWLELLPILNHRIPRLVLTQLLKRSPVNLRPILLIRHTQNPKALGLFLSSFVKMDRMGLLEEPKLVNKMIAKLANQRSSNNPHFCWGYSFPWQTRTHLVPRGAPNLVCTVFAANGLLDAYEHLKEPRCLEMATSAAKYIYTNLYWSDSDGSCGFSYPLPSVRNGVHNANLLGAALLCRVGKICSDSQYVETGLSVARYSAAKQRPDGSWTYGEQKTQQWIDNFHTGFNLCALRDIGQNAETVEFESCLRTGFQFYKSHFFREDAAPRYFHDKTYPIDIHSVAQSLIALSQLQDLEDGNPTLASSVLAWALRNMWDEQGYFYYRSHSCWRDRTAYMRWSQAWMLLAIASFLENLQRPRK